MKRPINKILKNWKSKYKSDFFEFLYHDCECEEKKVIDVVEWLENEFSDEGQLDIMAKQNTDVCNGTLLDWYGQNMEAVSDYQDSFGKPEDMEIMNQIRLAQIYWHRERIAEAANELIEILEEEK